MKPVAITGVGVVSPLGCGVEAFFAALAAGTPGIRRLEGAHVRRLAAPIGATVDFDAAARFPPPRLRMLDRVSQFALAAAGEALAQARGALAGIDPARAGVFLGTAMGGAHTTEEGYENLHARQAQRLKPFSVLMAMGNAPAAWIALDHGLTGPNLTYSTACSSSAVAVGEAARRIAAGEADVMVAGGAEAPLTFGILKAWEALQALAPEDAAGPGASCKPFAGDRAGLVLGEGAAILVLEDAARARRRGARVLAELVGYGLATDAVHITRPSVEGQAAAMRGALEDAAADAADVGYINAHGTGTAANDGVETAAVKAIFGERARAIPMSSTKSMHGHLLGAAGALELAACLLALGEGVLPPTINLRVRDPECDLDYVPLEARRVPPPRAVMSSSFAFGGTNAVLVARRAG